MLRELALHLQIGDVDKGVTGWRVGNGLYAGFRPENAPDKCLTLLERTGEKRSYDVAGKIDKPVMFLARSTSYDEARSIADSIVMILCGCENAGISLPVVSGGRQYTINTAELISGPAWLGQDTMGRHEFTVNILLHVQQES